MITLLLFSLAGFPLDPEREWCPGVCCKAFEVSCLACQLCVSAEEYCRRSPNTFGCKRFVPEEPYGEHGSGTDASNSTSLGEVYNGTHDVIMRFDQIKLNLSDAGFEAGGKMNPVIGVMCNGTEDCDLHIEVVQQQPNKTCVVSFEDTSSDMTSDDMDFGFKDEGDSALSKMQPDLRDSMKAEKDTKIIGRLQSLSFMGSVPESGAKREKADRLADFLSKAREDRDAFMRGESVARKLVQTRKMKSNLKSKLTRMVSSCFQDTILEDNVTNAEFEDVFISFNYSRKLGNDKFKPGGLGDIEISNFPTSPERPSDGWGDFRDIGFRFPNRFPYTGDEANQGDSGFPEGGRRLSEQDDTSNGNGGVVPVDGSTPPPSLPPTNTSPPPHSAPPPPSPPPPPAPCISTNASISASGDVYYIDGVSTPLSYGSFTLQLSITAQHPLRFHHEGGDDSCLPTLAATEAGEPIQYGRTTNLTGPLDNGTEHQYMYGNWQAMFPNNASCHLHAISLVCGYHGYMGGQNKLVWNDQCSTSPLPPPPPPSASPSSSPPPPTVLSPSASPPPNATNSSPPEAASPSQPNATPPPSPTGVPPPPKKEGDDLLMVCINIGVAALTVLSAFALSLVMYQRRQMTYNRIDTPLKHPPKVASLIRLQK